MVGVSPPRGIQLVCQPVIRLIVIRPGRWIVSVILDLNAVGMVVGVGTDAVGGHETSC